MSSTMPSPASITISAPQSVAALLRDQGVDPASRHLAVAVNGAVVRRADWSSHELRSGDTVEIVRPFQGG